MTRILAFVSDDDYSLRVEKVLKNLKGVLKKRYKCDIKIFRVDNPEVALAAMRYGVDELPSIVIDRKVFHPRDVDRVIRQLVGGRDPREIVVSEVVDARELKSKAAKIKNLALMSSIDLDSIIPGSTELLSEVGNLPDTIPKEKYSQIEEKIRLIEEAISRKLSERDEIEKIKDEIKELISTCTREIDELKALSKGTLPIDPLINRFSSMIREDILEACDDDRGCLSKGLKELEALLSEMKTVEEKLRDLKEILSGLSIEELRSPITSELDDMFSTLIFSDYVRYINSTLIPSLGGEVKIERPEEIDEFFKKLEEYEIASTVIKFLEDLRGTGLSLAELLSYEDPQVSKLFNELKALAVSRELSKIDAGRMAFRRLYEARRSLESLREIILESRKFIPIWEKYVLTELQKRKTISADELTRIPSRWRKFVLNKLIKSGEVILLPDNRLSYAFTIDSFMQVKENLEGRLERIYQALEKLESMGVEIPRSLKDEIREYLELVKSTEVASGSSREVLVEVVRRLRNMEARIIEIERELKSKL